MKHIFFSLLIGISIPVSLAGQAPKYTASFIAEWAQDTAGIETFTIAGNHLFGRAIHLYPEPHLRQFEFWYDDNGAIRSLDIQFYDLENTSIPLETKSGFLPYRIIMNYNNDVIDFRTISKEGEKQYVHLAKRMDFFGGWVPIFGQWQWLSNRVVENQLEKDLKFVNYVVGIYDLWLKQDGDDKVIFESSISAPITFYLNEKDFIEKIDALGSPWNYTVHKVEPIDIEVHTKHFAKKPVIGDPSPHKQFSTTIAGCNISGSYGQPSKRGREIFGNVVPYNKVWRTGAGPVTTISFDKDLVFNTTLIPRGTYNLFTVPGKDKWTLIFNTEENAWGSAPRSEYDFAKVEMQTEQLSKVVDPFSILIEENNGKGILSMMWDKTVAKVSFRIK